MISLRAIRDDDGVLIDPVHDRRNRLQGVDRGSGALCLPRERAESHDLQFPDPGAPGAVVGPAFRGALCAQRSQCLAGVCDYAQRHVAQSSDLLRIDLHVDQPGSRRNEPIAGAEREESKTHPEGQDDIGPLSSGQIRHLVKRSAIQRMRAWQETVCLKVREDGNPDQLCELEQLLCAVGLPRADSGHDHGPPRLAEELQCLCDRLLRGCGWGINLNRFGNRERSVLDLRAQHVGGQIEEHRAARPRSRDTNRMRHEPRDLLDRRDLVGPLGHGPRDGDLVDPGLQGVGLGIAQSGRSAEVQDRCSIQVRVRH